MKVKGALVVDDEPMICEFLRDVLESKVCETVFEAADGEEALRLLSEHGSKIELMILDLNMPKMAGDQVLAKLNTVHDGPLGVVLMSAHKTIETIVAENRDPGLHLVYIYKPFSIESFLLLTKSVLLRSRDAQAILA